ncbi:glycosyltransferase [Xanthomarina spongicola]|uniref:Colanic acid/amylovoran biosynthesis glycosyltransferase n=1 Tax=Xanthomarina spongicola TaxID=570520 RepID=A0A316DN64_9FLAO|nr:glycosyltransferase [Xanthomarina spongicola]PWK18629.1 colanic acid/amylovoran biosynthesis glycosyltransferase [Xanthomarina spongicola]
MKTICFTVPTYPALSETFITNQIVEAKKKGYSVVVLTHNLGKIEQSSQRKILETYSILDNTILIDLHIPKSQLKRFLVGLGLILKYFKYWIRLSDLTLRYRIINSPYLFRFYDQLRHINVFHIQFAAAGRGVAEMKACGFIQAKLITTFHGHDAHFANNQQLKSLQELYRFIFKVSDFITVNTPFLGQIVTQLGCNPEKLRVVFMGIDVSYFKSNQVRMGLLGNEVKLISVGRLVTFKGFKFAIEAIKLLVEGGLKVHYTIVGEGKLFDALQKQISALNLENYVALVGKKSQDEIKHLLTNHDVFLMSSITDPTGRCETQGVVTAEAQAMGLPVVAFNNGGIPYTIIDGETGVLVTEKDVEGYAKAIKDLIENKERYKLMSKAAIEFASSKFSNTLMMQQFMALYEA